ncbi:LANO_0H14884g1_1 [Lachancea nothofagi CBS 11611]|uniref:LANO_0H14884g1_1 n=1 Tax=Lachancea nothofagi CBS 11611 TaxID=1266666 RepID=A0A1G4KMH7_9SACH|nr:LANO_0H14884g1_1 [Lachancea nothofagi CBS 11611]
MGDALQLKRRKVTRACVYCRRSHMICDEQRPCTRCVRRNIAHLCHDEESGHLQVEKTGLEPNPGKNDAVGAVGGILARQPMFASEHVGSEFSSLNEFLNMLEDPLVLDANLAPNAVPQVEQRAQEPIQEQLSSYQPTLKENFFLTAADPSAEMTPEDRLKSVINAKLEAGLLKPYNYAKGYARLQTYMDKHMNFASKQRILKPLSIIRPEFRAIARSLKDVDLILVEESFERMLLSYDRVFTSMSMPACLWRRTGEIYRGNKEFASLVGCKVGDLRDGKLAIYEVMTEESTVSFWEKYGSVAFDKNQKAVLTHCKLCRSDGSGQTTCCFSFTIRRDRYNIPICIVGNFIPL